MSSPRYTSAESTLTISPPRRRAQSRASALLPEAVGPINAIAGGRGSCMACQPARMGVRTSGTSVAGFAQRSPPLLVDGLDLLRRPPVGTNAAHKRQRISEERTVGEERGSKDKTRRETE